MWKKLLAIFSEKNSEENFAKMNPSKVICDLFILRLTFCGKGKHLWAYKSICANRNIFDGIILLEISFSANINTTYTCIMTEWNEVIIEYFWHFSSLKFFLETFYLKKLGSSFWIYKS